MATDARSVSAKVKRARFAFTFVLLIRSLHSHTGSWAVSMLLEIPGFASPSRDGFALDGRQMRGAFHLDADGTGITVGSGMTHQYSRPQTYWLCGGATEHIAVRRAEATGKGTGSA